MDNEGQIRYLSQAQIDKKKWDECIDRAEKLKDLVDQEKGKMTKYFYFIKLICFRFHS